MINTSERLKSFWVNRALLKNLVIKNFRNRYSNTSLGFLWTIITPLLISLIISFVFTYITRVELVNFVAYVVCGMLPWICFSSSLQESAVSLLDNARLWKQFRVPLEFIPVSIVVINFLNLFIGLIVAGGFLIKSFPQIIFFLFLLPIPLILHFLFTLGLSFFLLPLYLKRKDVAYLLNIFLLFWLWVTPVFYVLDKFPASIQRLSRLNIAIPFLNLYRSIFYRHTFFDARDLLLSLSLSLLFFIYGFRFFLRQEHYIQKIL